MSALHVRERRARACLVMAEATGETTEALRRAMLPALPKLDTILLQKALAVAKQDGGVDQKLIKNC